MTRHEDFERDPSWTREHDPTRPPLGTSDLPRRLGGLAATAAQLDALDNPQPIGGGVSSLQDFKAQIAALQRAIQDQIRLINDFQKSNADTMQLVRTWLKGSTKGYDQQMLTALTQTEASLKSSLTGLQQASGALDRVRAI